MKYIAVMKTAMIKKPVHLRYNACPESVRQSLSHSSDSVELVVPPDSIDDCEYKGDGKKDQQHPPDEHMIVPKRDQGFHGEEVVHLAIAKPL